MQISGKKIHIRRKKEIQEYSELRSELHSLTQFPLSVFQLQIERLIFAAVVMQ
jgi:hypothetical protein